MTKAGQVYQSVRDDIMSGRLAPGAVVDEATLAAVYQVSRTPVREALKSLAADGLLTTGARRQMVVVDASAEHRAEITLLRIALEGAAATVAGDVVTEDDLDGLQLIIIKQRRFAEAGDSEAFLQLDEQFHKALAGVARLPTLSHFLGQLGAFIRLTRLNVPTSSSHMLGLVTEHEQLLTLLTAGAGSELQHALAEHIRNTSERSGR